MKNTEDKNINKKDIEVKNNILTKRKIRLSVIIIVSMIILSGIISICFLGIDRETSVLQTTITAISTVIGGLVGALSVIIKFYFDGSEE